MQPNPEIERALDEAAPRVPDIVQPEYVRTSVVRRRASLSAAFQFFALGLGIAVQQLGPAWSLAVGASISGIGFLIVLWPTLSPRGQGRLIVAYAIAVAVACGLAAYATHSRDVPVTTGAPAASDPTNLELRADCLEEVARALEFIGDNAAIPRPPTSKDPDEWFAQNIAQRNAAEAKWMQRHAGPLRRIYQTLYEREVINQRAFNDLIWHLGKSFSLETAPENLSWLEAQCRKLK